MDAPAPPSRTRQLLARAIEQAPCPECGAPIGSIADAVTFPITRTVRRADERGMCDTEQHLLIHTHRGDCQVKAHARLEADPDVQPWYLISPLAAALTT